MFPPVYKASRRPSFVTFCEQLKELGCEVADMLPNTLERTMMSVEEPEIKPPEEVRHAKYKGQAIQRANVRLFKLSKVMKKLRSAIAAKPEITPDELTKVLYPNWEEMTLEDFENKEWYVEEKLLPLLDEDSGEVYQDALDEEQARLTSIGEAKKNFGW